MLKKILIGLAAVVVLLVAAVLIVPGLIPAETYTARIAAEVERATGRELRIGGDVDVQVIPRVAIAMEDVAFANAPGGEAADMVTLSRLDVELAIWPLLSGEVAIDRFVLVEPAIALEVDADGRPNWRFEPASPTDSGADAAAGTGDSPGSGAGGAADAPAGTPSAETDRAGRLSDIRLGEVAIRDGRISYHDAGAGTRHVAEDVDLTVSLPDLDSAFAADGALTWRDERVTLKLTAGTPRAFLEGGETTASVALASEPVDLDWSGRVVMNDPPAAAGPLTLEIPSLREAAAWAGSPVEGMEGGLGPLSIEGALAVEGAKFSFTEAAIALDEIDAQGSLIVDANGARPALSGRLDVETLDLNPYLPPERAEGEQPAPGGNGQGQNGQDRPEERQQPPAGWSTEPIDLTALRAADAEFALTAGAIRFREIEIGKSALNLTLAGGRLTADLTEMALYEGNGTARLVADGAGEVPAIEARLDLAGVQAQPLLTDAAGFERLSGAANAAATVSARGASQAAMVAASQGQGSLAFADGAIQGINLAAMVRNVESAFLDPDAREVQATDFSELTGTFTIRDGILRNEDLRMLSPLLRIEGKGTADLPARTLDYRVEPRAVASVEGQGGRTDVAGVMVPVLIAGPWHDLSYRPDLEGMIRQQIEDPSKALEQLERLRGGGSEGGTEDGSQDGGSTPSLEDAGEGLKKLFGK